MLTIVELEFVWIEYRASRSRSLVILNLVLVDLIGWSEKGVPLLSEESDLYLLMMNAPYHVCATYIRTLTEFASTARFSVSVTGDPVG